MADTEVVKCIRDVYQLEMRENLKIQNTHTKENSAHAGLKTKEVYWLMQLEVQRQGEFLGQLTKWLSIFIKDPRSVHGTGFELKLIP